MNFWNLLRIKSRRERKIVNKTKYKRLYGIDLLRVIAMLFIFLFHTYIHLGCNYGIMNVIISQGAIFMVAFFMISGFSLYYTYCDSNSTDIKKLTNFYIRRFSAIIPVYLVVYLVYLVVIKTDLSWIKNLIIAPLELLLLQSTIGGTKAVLHNSGTWFVSCLGICYIMFPFLCEIIKQMNKKILLWFGLVLFIICGYVPIVVRIFEFNSSYSNPFFRLLEFMIGMIIAKVYVHSGGRGKKYINLVVLSFSALFTFVWVLQSMKIGNYETYVIIAIPIFGYSMLCLARANEFVLHGKMISLANSICYEIFMAQFFTWGITLKIVKYIPILNNNCGKVLISFAVCLVEAIVLYRLITRPVKKIIRNRMKY